MTKEQTPQNANEGTTGPSRSTVGLGVARCKHWQMGMHTGDAPYPYCEINRLRTALSEAISTLERDGDEWGICTRLRKAMA